MDSVSVINKFESNDSHLIWEATWDILYASPSAVKALRPKVERFQEIIRKSNLGGRIFSNTESAYLACRYIERSADGYCRCQMVKRQSLFSPVKEAENEFAKIVSRELKKALFEEHFHVTCRLCGQSYFVREVGGWHVQWYEWTQV